MSGEKWSGKTEGWGFGIKIFIALIKVFGFPPAYVLLVPVCFVYTIINAKAKKAIKQFRNRLGLKTNFFDYYAHFFSFSLSIVHRMGLLVGVKNKIKYETQNEDRIETAVKKGKGVILLSSHIGNFWLATEIFGKILNAPINVLMVERESEKMKKVYEKLDEKRKINIIASDENPIETALKIKTALQNGEIVAALGDRFIDENVSEIEFLGEKAKFPRGIFEIACLTQAPIVPGFMIRQKSGVYCFCTGEIIEIPKVEREKRREVIDEAMRNFVGQISEQVRKTPFQWYNFYCFWD